LVSELHPDREADPVEQVRKTELMQQVNQAYKAGDLLALLELQFSIEQIDAAALAGLAEDRLRHYVHVLEEQSRQLREELAEVIEPFAAVLGESPGRRVTTDAVQRLLDRDIRELKTIVRKVEMDVICFRDIRQLKQSLGEYHVEPLDDDELDMPDDFDSWARPRPPAGRPGRPSSLRRGRRR
jgi:ATP-dependent helicase/DNAse subunit B